MSLTKTALRFAAPVPQAEAFERYLFIGPHPDDIEIGAGATAAKLAAAGKQVSFLVCMDGRYGLENAPAGTTPEELAVLRKEEAIASARLLGVSDIHFLELCDGGAYDTDALLSGMARVIGKVQPQILFAPNPDATSECHADHISTGEAAKKLAFFAPFEGIMAGYGASSAKVQAIAFYMTARPNRFVKTLGLMGRQRAAILCHKTQFTAELPAYKDIALYLRLRAVDFGLRSLYGHAEGFRVLGRTQMHCLPEAGE